MPEAADSHPPHSEADDDSRFSESGETVLTSGSRFTTGDFPQGLPPRELAQVLQGERLDHFQLQEFVGGGGMGVVFKALDTTLHRIVAVKVVASRNISSEDLHRRFMVEAQSTARLDHPNIARIHLVGRDRGLPYIVFEYIEGANIRDLVVNHGPMPLGDALGFTYQIAHALAHAWQREVVHRDIKPSNILVTPEGLAKLVDMGLARLYQGDSSVNSVDDLTSTGVTLGTFDYISPEQALDPREADTRSDIYSLGCTLFYMLAGRPPFPSGTAAQKLLQHQGDLPPNLQSLCEDIPEQVSHMVQMMLAKSPDERHQTPSELVAELAEIMHGLGIALPQSLAPLSVSPRQWKTTVWMNHAPWAVPLAAVVAAGMWFGSGGDSGQEKFELPPLRSAKADHLSSDRAAGQIQPPALPATLPAADKSTTSDEASPTSSVDKSDFQLDVGNILDDVKLMPEADSSTLDPANSFSEPTSQSPSQADLFDTSTIDTSTIDKAQETGSR